MLNRASARLSAISSISLPVHIAGSVESATRLRIQLRRLAISSVRLSWPTFCFTISQPDCRSSFFRSSRPRLQLLKELGRRCEKGVLLENTADNSHRVGAKNVHYDSSAKLGEIICSYNRIIILRQYEI